jgi:hypothetical protein
MHGVFIPGLFVWKNIHSSQRFDESSTRVQEKQNAIIWSIGRSKGIMEQ